jgi:hypothetical protein
VEVASTKSKTIGSFFNVKQTSAESTAAAAAAEVSFVYHSVAHHHRYMNRLWHKTVEYNI